MQRNLLGFAVAILVFTACDAAPTGPVEPPSPNQLVATDAPCLEKIWISPTRYRCAKRPAPAKAWIWADQASTSGYVPALNYQYNSSGRTNEVRRTGVGRYSVRLPALQSVGTGSLADYGTVLVSAYGGNHRCKAGNWGPNKYGIDVEVFCHGPNGAPADGQYTVLYYRESVESWPEGTDRVASYLFAETLDGTASPKTSWASAPFGYEPRVYGDESNEEYYAHLFRSAFIPGTTFVTANGSGPDYCNNTGPVSSSGEWVSLVRCWSPSGTRAFPTKFTLSYLGDIPWVDLTATRPHGVAIGVASGLPYHRGAVAQIPIVRSGCVDATIRGISVGRLACATGRVGETRVQVPDVWGPSSTAIVSSNQADRASYCTLKNWSGRSANVTVTVRCYDDAGDPAESRFSLLFLSNSRA